MGVLSTAFSVFGVITVALALYYWHLTRQRPSVAGPLRALPGANPRGAAAGEPFARPRPRQRSGIFPRAVLQGASGALHEPLVGLDRRGVYTTAEDAGARPELRGQQVAERVISDGNTARRVGRGRNAALDAIVVGASREGLAATLCLLSAGRRVLLVDARSADGRAAAALACDPSVRWQLRALQRERLPIVWGHHVVGVTERPDGMLELSAERAAWYTANVIIARPQSSRVGRERAA